MKDVTIEHLGHVILFALIGILFSWIARRVSFFTLPKISKPPPIQYPIIGLILYLVIFLFTVPLALKFFSFAYSPFKAIFTHHPSLLAGVVQVLSIMITTCFVMIFSFFQNQGVVKTIWKKHFTWTSAFKDFGLGIITWVISFPFIICIDQLGDFLTLLIFGISDVEQVAVRYVRLSIESPFLLTVAIISTVLAAPLLEEWIFRGFIQTYLKAKMGFFKALLCSSLIFALFHISPTQGVGNFTLVSSLFTFALYLGFIYEKRKSLIASIALHMTFNSISVMRIVLFSS